MAAIAAVSALVPLSIRTTPRGAYCRANKESSVVRSRAAATLDAAARTPASNARQGRGECTGSCRRHAGTEIGWVAPAAGSAVVVVVTGPDPPAECAIRAQLRPPQCPAA